MKLTCTVTVEIEVDFGPDEEPGTVVDVRSPEGFLSGERREELTWLMIGASNEMLSSLKRGDD